MCAFVFVGVRVSECQLQDTFVCFGAKRTQSACLRDFLRNWKFTREGKVPDQWTEEGSQQERAVDRSRGKATFEQREELGPVDLEARSVKARGWVSIPGGFVGIFAWIHALDNSHMSRKLHKSVANFSLLALWPNPSPCFFFLLFLCMLYLVYMQNNVKCPWPEMRETTRRSEGHELVVEVVIVGTSQWVYCHYIFSDMNKSRSL